MPEKKEVFDTGYYDYLISEIDRQNESLEDTRKSIQQRSQSLLSVTLIIIGLLSSISIALIWNETSPVYQSIQDHPDEIFLIIFMFYLLLLSSLVNGFSVIMTEEYEIGFNVINLYLKSPDKKSLVKTILFEKYKQSLMNEPPIMKLTYYYKIQHISLYMVIPTSVLGLIIILNMGYFYLFLSLFVIVFIIGRIIHMVNFYSRYSYSINSTYTFLAEVEDHDRMNILLSSPIREFRFNVMRYFVGRQIMKEFKKKEREVEDYPKPVESRRMEKVFTNKEKKDKEQS